MPSDKDAGDAASAQKSDLLQENLAKIEGLTQRLVAAMARKREVDAALHGPSQEVYMKAAAAMLAEMMANPAKLIEHQVAYWAKSVTHYAEAQKALASGNLVPPEDTGPADRRFANPLWDSHPGFNFIKQQYLLNTEAVTAAVRDIGGLDASDHKRLDYFTRQIMDMFSPTNFLGTNPDALQRAVETNGESLVQGLENLVRDLEANDGELIVTLSDPQAFHVGRNLATTEGAVVYRNKMMEIIQYAPTTETVHELPIVLFPPWINKFYVLDLKPANSLIKWIVDQGFTLFVVSWVNPDASYADVGMDDYIRDGYLRAMAEARRITGAPKVNAVGYCIAGTTLGLTLAYLDKAGDPSVNSATFFTTLTDFSDSGEVGVFLDNDFVDGIERQCQRDGILSRLFMSRTFSFLRSTDLIYQPAIKSYMLGEAPPAFDLLYWNGDGTNLPAKMAVEYLRGLCQDDGFAEGTFKVLGHRVSLADVKLPLMSIACETDHIAHWRGCFNGVAKMGSADKTFVLSQSGHIAGIVNPPARNKYGHYTNTTPITGAPEEWRASAQFTPASWWPLWAEWLRARSGGQVPARVLVDSPDANLGPAPGTYVTAIPKAVMAAPQPDADQPDAAKG